MYSSAPFFIQVVPCHRYHPVFESYRCFLMLNFQQLTEEQPTVRAYLASFPAP